MTLILNEIHILNGLQDSFIVAGADRRITNPDGSYHSSEKKLFNIPYLNGTISFFGLAEVFPGGKRTSLSTWLPNFINRQSSAKDLLTFCKELWEELNGIVPGSLLDCKVSGFHISGYTREGYPDFWFISNIGRLEQFYYADLKSRYNFPESHFLGRDAKKELGWDGKNPLSAKNSVYFYRNGDFRAHALAFGVIDEIYKRFSQFPDFKPIITIEQYSEYIKFKFDVVSFLYKKWAKKVIIGRPIDVILIKKPAL